MKAWGHDYSVALVIRGVDLDPVFVTSELGIQPSLSWRKGDVRTTRPALVSGWELEVHPNSETRHWDDLEQGLNAALDLLEPKRDIIRKLQERYTVCWWIGHFQSCFDGGPAFSPGLLSRLAAFGVELGIDNYFSGQEPVCFTETEPVEDQQT
jgi:hypothetical protein